MDPHFRGDDLEIMKITAYCKINLFLEITGKLPNGYHTLETIFQTVSLGDTLTFRAAKDLTMTCSDPTLPTDERNLVMRAALRLREALKETRGAHIHLKKVVPMGAGLGGGSSDAAATLLALQTLWKRRLPSKKLLALASTLGADVAFFLKGGTALGRGIGDQLKSLPKLPKTWLVLVYPNFGVATKEAYARIELPLTDPRSILRMVPRLKSASPDPWAPDLFNRFEQFVFQDHPVLSLLKQELIDAGALGSLMSGSGSTVFGVVSSQSQGKRVLAKIRQTYPKSWLVHTI